MLEVRKRQNESPNSLMFRFNKRVKQSGLVKEARKRRFATRKTSKIKRKSSALHKATQQQEYTRKKKLGLIETLHDFKRKN